jgi:PqqD family protein of HPr-rel-A system
MWQLTPGQAFCLRQYGDEFVLYNDLSGATHLLADSAVHLLSVLQQGPRSDDALAAALAAALDCARDQAFDDQAGRAIAQLASLFLIQSV